MKLYYHPISSYAQKALMALYEKNISFTPELVNLMDEADRKKYRELYPLGKVPLLTLDDGYMIPESTIIIEYLETHYDNEPRLIPEDPDGARQVRFKDRMIDLYLNESVNALIFQSWKPEEKQDQELIKKSHFRINVMYKFLNEVIDEEGWIHGKDFTLADCAAAPVLFYAKKFSPFDEHSKIKAYAERLHARDSYQRILKDAGPYLEKM